VRKIISLSCDRTLSKRVLHRELQNAGVAGALNGAERGRSQITDREIEVGVIQRIEELEPQL
jgi:hypothetical protein